MAFDVGPQAAVSMLKQDYKEGEMTLSAALALAVKVLNKTMDVSKLSAEKGEGQKYFLSVVLLTYSDLFHVKLEQLMTLTRIVLLYEVWYNISKLKMKITPTKRQILIKD